MIPLKAFAVGAGIVLLVLAAAFGIATTNTADNAWISNNYASAPGSGDPGSHHPQQYESAIAGATVFGGLAIPGAILLVGGLFLLKDEDEES